MGRGRASKPAHGPQHHTRGGPLLCRSAATPGDCFAGWGCGPAPCQAAARTTPSALAASHDELSACSSQLPLPLPLLLPLLLLLLLLLLRVVLPASAADNAAAARPASPFRSFVNRRPLHHSSALHRRGPSPLRQTQQAHGTIRAVCDTTGAINGLAGPPGCFPRCGQLPGPSPPVHPSCPATPHALPCPQLPDPT